MAGSGGFSISITAVDKTTGVLDNVNKRLARLAAPAEKFNRALSKFGDTSGLSRVTEGVRSLGAGAAGTFRSLDRMASPLAAITSVGSIAGIVELSRRWAEFGTRVGQVAYRLDAPVEKLGALRGAARLAGVGAADLDTGLGSLDEKLRGAAFGRDSGAIQLFRSLNIGFGDANNGARTATDALGDVAEAIHNAKDPRDQQYIADQLGLGSLLPLLKNGRKGLQDFQKQAEQTGGVMTGQMVKNATEMNTAWQRLGLDFEGVGIRIVDSWSGTVTKVLDNSSKWIENNKKTADSITQIGTAVGLLAALKPAAWVLRLLGLGSFIPGAGTALVTAPLAAGYFAQQMGIDLVGPNGYGASDWSSGSTPDPSLYQNNPNGWWARHAPTWLGGNPSASAKNPADPNQLRKYFRSQGWSDPQISGILGNYQGESGLDAAAIGDRGASAGLGMWRGARRGGFRLMFGHDVSEGTPLEQAKFTQWELTHTESAAGDALRAAKTAREAGSIFSMDYERPQDVGMNAALRGQYAETWQQKVSAEPTVSSEPAYAKSGDRLPGYFSDNDGTKGHVQVDVHIKGAPPGTTGRTTTTGPVLSPPPRIESPMPLVN